MKRLYLVDVSSMFFRAFFAIPRLSNDKGMPTNALYGFLSMTLKLLREVKPDYLAFCFDSKEPSFRYDIYPEYKAHRDEMPEDLVPQVPYVKKLCELLGAPILEIAGVEADDLIGTLTRIGRGLDLEVVIVSGDKDFAQLIESKVSMYDTMKEVRYNPEGVKEKWGVNPEQMIDYLALVGDTSDNIPGVKGIGPKGAQKLLHQYGHLTGIYEHLSEISGKALKANLEQNRELAFLSQRLVTIEQNIPVEMNLEQLRMRPTDRDGLRQILLDLGFKTFVRQLTGETASGERAVAQTPVDVARPASSVGAIKERQIAAVELADVIPENAEVWGLLDERGFYLGLNSDVFLIPAEPERLGRILQPKNLRWQGFDLKAVWHYLKLNQPIGIWDSLLAAYVLRPTEVPEFGKTYGRFLGQPLPDLLSPSELMYSHIELKKALEANLAQKNERSVLDKLDLPLMPILYEMESRGVAIDLPELARQSEDLKRDIRRLEDEIFKLSGGPFNVASPKQLANVLFNKLSLPPVKKTKTGFSTDSDVLEKLMKLHPIAEFLIEYRELTKLKSTYVDALPILVNKRTGRLHTHFNPAGTVTGRMSSENPNLQNIPIRTERGRRVRKAFVADEGQLLLSADYSQIELRILAHVSSDEALIRAFSENLDIHMATAAEIFSVPLDKVSDEQRRRAKAVNFGIAYGQGAFGLSESLGISRSESGDNIDRYFKRFKGVKTYMEEIVERAKKNGFVETLFGRRRDIEELNSRNAAIRKFGERVAVNSPIQGTASDLVKLAMIEVRRSVKAPLLLQVHDELLLEVPIPAVEETMVQVMKAMEGVAQLKVPLRVNVSTGPNWDFV
jgi:DNA polymerase I